MDFCGPGLERSRVDLQISPERLRHFPLKGDGDFAAGRPLLVTTCMGRAVLSIAIGAMHEERFMTTSDTLSQDSLARLAAVIESRKIANGGDPEKSYVARLLHKGPDAFLKKVGEEATEVVMAAKDAEHGGDKSKILYEVADLWFHSMIALAHFDLTPAQVIAELERREGLSGLEEKALRKAVDRAEQEKGQTS